ncbi:MAG: hypothetical protein ACE5E2_04140 [Candidatus Binatia bacterium]
MHGIKIHPDNESLAEDISNALKKRRLKKGICYDLLGPLVDIRSQQATMYYNVGGKLWQRALP